MLFLGLLSYWLYWTRCSFRVVLTPQLRAKLESWLKSAEDWRRDSPRMFCLVSGGCLASLAILGHLISGSTLVLTLLVLSALVSTRYNFKLLQIEHKGKWNRPTIWLEFPCQLTQSFTDFQWSEKINYTNVEADADDEFLPDCNESNMFVLERASDVAIISSPPDVNGAPDEDDDDEEEGSDDIPAELLIPDVIPEIDENSTDEEDDLVPLVAKGPSQQIITSDVTSSSSAPGKKMDFCKGHFKRDSSLSTTSSSSEESLSKGLQFPDHTSVDAGGSSLRQLTAPPSSNDDATGAGSNLLAMAVKAQAQALLPSLVSGLVQWGAGNPGNSEVDSATLKQHRRQVTALDSSDDSDFEILQADDCK